MSDRASVGRLKAGDLLNWHLVGDGEAGPATLVEAVLERGGRFVGAARGDDDADDSGEEK